MRDERGSVLITTYLVTTVLLAFGATALARSLSEHQIAERSSHLNVTLYLAEAGVDRAIAELKNSSSWGGVSYTGLAGQGGYAVTLTSLSSTVKQVTSTGYYPSNDSTAAGYQTRRVETTVQLPLPSVFQAGIFGDDEVDIKKAVTSDSYDSRNGSYAGQTHGEKGDVGTNNTEKDSISLSKDTVIHGQVIVGPGMTDPTTAVKLDKNVTITGNPQIVSEAKTLTLPAVSAPCVATTDLKLDKTGSVTLSESHGPYCYKKVELKDSASLVVSGNVSLYASEFTADKDSTINGAGKPTQFLLEITSDEEVKIKNTGVFSGAIYAPQSKVSFEKSGEFYGAVVANEVSVDKEFNIHYDTALSDTDPTTGQAGSTQVLSWREP